MREPPVWFSVWAWLRFVRQPSVSTSLPQQGLDPEAMSLELYERYRTEWLQAGSPSLTSRQLIAAMSASEFEELPF